MVFLDATRHFWGETGATLHLFWGETAAEFRQDGCGVSTNGGGVPAKRQQSSGEVQRRLRSFDEQRRSSGETAAEFRWSAADFRWSGEMCRRLLVFRWGSCVFLYAVATNTSFFEQSTSRSRAELISNSVAELLLDGYSFFYVRIFIWQTTRFNRLDRYGLTGWIAMATYQDR
jgi:hypothetical protein